MIIRQRDEFHAPTSYFYQVTGLSYVWIHIFRKFKT